MKSRCKVDRHILCALLVLAACGGPARAGLTTDTVTATNALVNQGYFRWSSSLVIPGSVTNQLCYVEFGNTRLMGWVEISLSAGTDDDSGVGRLSKRFAALRTISTTARGWETQEVSHAFGPIVRNWHIGDFESTTNALRVPLYHLTSHGDTVRVTVEGHIESAYVGAVVNALALSAVSTQAFTQARQYAYFSDDRLGVGTADPQETLHVAGTGRFDNGIPYVKALGGVSMGVFTNQP